MRDSQVASCVRRVLDRPQTDEPIGGSQSANIGVLYHEDDVGGEMADDPGNSPPDPPIPDPAPSPSPPPPSPRPWWRRIDWGITAQLITALAAVGGLVGSTIAIYYSTMVAENQLDQARRLTDRQVVDQASRFTYWTTRNGTYNGWRLHVLNRSPDPITNVFILVQPQFTGAPTPTSQIQLVIESVAPCTEISVKPPEPKAFGLMSDGSVWKPQWNPGLVVRQVVFDDSRGLRWLRLQGRLVANPVSIWNGTAIEHYESKAAATCTDTSSS